MFESSLRGTRTADDARAAGSLAADRHDARADRSLAAAGHDVRATAASNGPDAVAAALADLAASLAEVSAAADHCTTWTGPQRLAVLAGMDRLAAVLTTTRARWLLAEQDAGTSVRTG